MDYNYNRLMFGPSKPLEYAPILDKLYPSEEKQSCIKPVEVKVNAVSISDNLKEMQDNFAKNNEEYKIKVKGSWENNMDIINLYFDRKEAEICKKYNDKIAEIKKNDEIQLIVDEMTSQINAILENENRSYTQHFDMDIHTQKTQTALEKVYEDKKNELYKLKEDKEEVLALFKLTTDFSERMKILKDYGIISKGGKVNK